MTFHFYLLGGRLLIILLLPPLDRRAPAFGGGGGADREQTACRVLFVDLHVSSRGEKSFKGI